MKIRQYTAASMQEALNKIKVDLGPDAVILHTRKFKQGGFLGLFAQERFEVLAAVDPPEAKESPKPAAALSHRMGASPAPAAPAPQPLAEPARGELSPAARAALEVAFGAQAAAQAASAPAFSPPTGGGGPKLEIELGPLAAAAPAPRAPVAPPAPGPDLRTLSRSVEDLQSLVKSLAERLDAPPAPPEPAPAASGVPRRFTGAYARLYERLLAFDLLPPLAEALLDAVRAEQPDAAPEAALVAALAAPLRKYLRVSGPIAPVPEGRRVIALVGPTGVGKTTTMAKLAATLALEGEAKLGLVTLDTYRVAAIEQLKTYGDIIGLPVDVVNTPQGLKETLAEHPEHDLVLIDTAGRSPSHRLHLQELVTFLDFEPRAEVHLVLSASTRLADLRRIVEQFAPAGVSRLIFTKTDETQALGAMLTIAHETGWPIAYVANGQSVPDHLMLATEDGLAKLLVEGLTAAAA